jgi:hypothetical protein
MCIEVPKDYLLFGYCYCYLNMQVLIMAVIDFLEDCLSLTVSHEIIFIFLRLYGKPNANQS